MATTATVARLTAALLAVLALAGCGEDDADAMTVDTDLGVTQEPCPDAVDAGHGCIYLGTLTDRGDAGALGEQLTTGGAAFWERVNAEGGIGGYEVDTGTHLRDTGADPDQQAAAYEEIRGDVLALTQSFGAAATEAVLGDLDDDDVLVVPASWASDWDFSDIVLQSGASYCVAAMNALDHAVDALAGVEQVLVVHFPGVYGEDAAAGVAAAAEHHDIEVAFAQTLPGAEEQEAAVDLVVEADPDLVFVATGPLELAAIVGQAVPRGFEGQVVGSAPTWDPGLLDSPAAADLEERYWQAAPWPPWGAGSEGHDALRATLDDVTPHDAYLAGWVRQYPLRAAIEAAIDRGDLTRAGVRTAAAEIAEVDYESILPAAPGEGADDPEASAVRASGVAEVDATAPTGLAPLVDFLEGPTVAAHAFDAPCHEGL